MKSGFIHTKIQRQNTVFLFVAIHGKKQLLHYYKKPRTHSNVNYRRKNLSDPFTWYSFYHSHTHNANKIYNGTICICRPCRMVFLSEDSPRESLVFFQDLKRRDVLPKQVPVQQRAAALPVHKMFRRKNCDMQHMSQAE